MSTAHCRACGSGVAVAEFCGSCGARQSGGRTGVFRLGAYAAAPSQRVLAPWVTTSLFPELPPRSRNRFRAALIALLVVLAGTALLRWQAPMIVTAVFAVPMLLLLYVRATGLRPRDAVVAIVIAVALGVGWAVIVGPVVSQAYSEALGGEVDLEHVLLSGVAIPVSEALSMLVPAVVVRAMNRSGTDPLTGFSVGALGATFFNGAGSMVLLAPQLAMGVIAHGQSDASLLVEALVEGVAWPVSSLAAGGIFGIALWLKLSGSGAWRRRLLVLAAAMAALVMASMGVVDVAPLSLRAYVAAQMMITVVAVVALRLAIAGALLHQSHDGTGTDGSLPCGECGQAKGPTAFCAACGVAAGALSGDRPAVTYPGVLGPLAAGLAVVVAAGVGTSVLLTPATKAYVCPPDCGRPPLGTPVETNPRFSGDGGAFSVSYPGEGSAYDVIFDPPGINGVELRYLGGDTGTLWLFGEPADGRTSRQIVERILATKYPGATVAYEIPNASVGYEPGYGVVADAYSREAAASYTRLRVIVMAAVKHDYALIATAVGPYHEFGPDYGTGHPSGANLELAMDMGKYVNSFRWNGDRYGRRP